ncbi:hypothetical protein Tco_0355351 [Tanacetum coccineum]
MHMLTPKPSSYYTGLGKSSFANPLYLKQAQKEKPYLYNIKYDKNDLANLFAPKYEETLRLAEESRSKVCKDKVKPYDYMKQNNLYELFTPQTEKSREQLFFANEIRRNIFRKSFQKQTTNLIRRIEYLPTKASISKNMLMPLTQDTKSRALLFETQFKTEMFADLKYVQSLEKEVDELQTDKNEFLKEYDILLQECVSKDIICSILHSFADIDEQTELQCLYLEKIEECECLASELSKRNENAENKSFMNYQRSLLN